MTDNDMNENRSHYNHIIAFDVGKDELWVKTTCCQTPQKMDNTASKIKRLLQRELKRNKDQQPGPMLVIAEATGGYERAILEAATKLEIDCHRAHGSSVRAYAKYIGKHAKSDPIDVDVIYKYAIQTNDLHKYQPPCKESAILRELKAMRDDLMKAILAENNRLEHAHSSIVRKSRRKIIRLMQREIATIEAEIDQLIAKNETFSRQDELMQSVKGVGRQTVVSALAYMPELGQLSKGAAAALAGVAPYNNDSSKYRGKRHIFAGRSELRACLYKAAESAIRWNHILKPFAERLKAKGKPYKVVVTAVMRKLIIILNAILREQKPWKHAENA